MDELRDCVARRVAEGLAIYPQGGRTSIDYGGVPGRPGVIVDTTALDRVIDYPAADMTITVEAGMPLSRLQSLLATEGQFLPLDAPFPDRATLGGIYATNSCGPRRLGWGRPRDMIIGVSFVTADGHEVKGGGRVVKNVAGYDFPKLLTGSMGTLGIITQMTLKVRPKPEASAFAIASFNARTDPGPILAGLNTSLTRPTAMIVLNREASLRMGLPADTDEFGNLLLGFEDNSASVAWQCNALSAEIPTLSWTIREGDEASALWSSLAQFPGETLQENQEAEITVEAHLPRSRGLEFGREIASARPSQILIHAGSGVVVAHLLGQKSLDENVELIKHLQKKASNLGGSLTLTRCPTEMKGRLSVWGESRPDWAIMQKIKSALDPGGVMNPGRFVGTI